MLTVESTKELIELLMPRHSTNSAYLVLHVPEAGGVFVEQQLKELRKLGYMPFVRTTAMGQEIVIADKVDHGDVGPSRNQSS